MESIQSSIKTSTMNVVKQNAGIVTCPKCKRNFHSDNYPGHERYEIELENGNKPSDMIQKGRSTSIMINAPAGRQFNISRIISEEHKQLPSREEIEDIAKGLDTKSRDNLLKLIQNADEKKISLKCTICFENFKMNEEVITLPKCLHSFHMDHLFEWINSNTKCHCGVEIADSLV